MNLAPVSAEVSQANQLIEACYTMTLSEKRLVVFAISKLDGSGEMPTGGKVTLTASEYAQVFGIEPQTAYEQLQDGAAKLYARNIREIRTGRAGRKVERNTRWVYQVDYLPGEGTVQLGFAPPTHALLSQLSSNFTTIELKQISNLTSVYPMRLYEMARMWISRRETVASIGVDELRARFDISDQYTNFRDFRRCVLDPAVKAVCAETDVELMYRIKTEGRKATHIEFIAISKERQN